MIINRKIHLSQYVEIIRSSEMRIGSKNNLVHLDGEPKKLENPIEIKNYPKSLNIFIPNE